jgi:PPK2 family polyphosphate:nucleotide phosphotransferase
MPDLIEPIGLKNVKHLDDLEHKKIEEDEYKPKLKEAQVELLHWQRELSESKNRLIVVFEGPDAAGKGGAIKRMTERLDPRMIRVHSIVKPTHEENQQHYLWRFWNKLPPYGQIAIFDRSWYGRVLVERVEEFATDKEWKRAYEEINDFERVLFDDGAIIVKFYLHISKDEQLYRFKRREADPMKHWKINDEDWRNRKRWDEHNAAAEDVFEKTSTEYAPWHVVPANWKWYARVKVVRSVVEAIEKAKLRKLS